MCAVLCGTTTCATVHCIDRTCVVLCCAVQATQSSLGWVWCPLALTSSSCCSTMSGSTQTKQPARISCCGGSSRSRRCSRISSSCCSSSKSRRNSRCLSMCSSNDVWQVKHVDLSSLVRVCADLSSPLLWAGSLQDASPYCTSVSCCMLGPHHTVCSTVHHTVCSTFIHDKSLSWV